MVVKTRERHLNHCILCVRVEVKDLNNDLLPIYECEEGWRP